MHGHMNVKKWKYSSTFRNMKEILKLNFKYAVSILYAKKFISFWKWTELRI
jgi:hypothetical protein